jgi:hypothetical protein
MFASTQMQIYSDTNFNLILIITLDDEDMIYDMILYLFYMENMAPYYIIAINIDALLFHVILI